MEADTSLMKGVFISPEGAEEKIVTQMTYRITMTQNGKFRVYLDQGDNQNPTSRMYESKKEANDALGHGMMMVSGLILDPKNTLDLLIESFKGKPRD